MSLQPSPGQRRGAVGDEDAARLRNVRVRLDDVAEAHLESLVHAAAETTREHSARAFAFLASQVPASAYQTRVLDSLHLAIENDEVPAVRIAAAWALGEIGLRGSIAVLRRVSERDSDVAVRHHAHEQLTRILPRE